MAVLCAAMFQKGLLCGISLCRSENVCEMFKRNILFLFKENTKKDISVKLNDLKQANPLNGQQNKTQCLVVCLNRI